MSHLPQRVKSTTQEVRKSHENLEQRYKEFYEEKSQIVSSSTILEDNITSISKNTLQKNFRSFSNIDKIHKTITNTYFDTNVLGDNSKESNTLPRRPIAAPRRTKTTLMHPEKPMIVKRVQNEVYIPNIMFGGSIERFRKECIDEMDTYLKEMISSGYLGEKSVLNNDLDGSSNEPLCSENKPKDEYKRYENIIPIDHLVYNQSNPPQAQIRATVERKSLQSVDCITSKPKEHEKCITDFSAQNMINIAENQININKEPPPKLKPKVINITKNVFAKTDIGSRGNTPPNDGCEYEFIENSRAYEPIIPSSYVKKIGLKTNLKNPVREDDNTNVSARIVNILEHLKSSEKLYLKELQEVIPVFLYVIKHHTNLEIRSRIETICAVVEKLLIIQTKFENQLTGSNTLEMVLRVFIDYEKLFFVYRQFFTQISNGIVITIEDTQNDFTKDITLGGILNQRLVHYVMFLNDIRTELAGHNHLLHVVLYPLDAVTQILHSCNNILALSNVVNNPLVTNIDGSLCNPRDEHHSADPKRPFDVSGYGNYLLKENFKVTTQFKITLTVYLFDNVILLTKKGLNDEFYYHGSIKMSEIRLLETPKGESKKYLYLNHFVKSKRFHREIIYKFKAPTESIQETWRNKIKNLLWEQYLIEREKVLAEHEECSEV